MKTTSTLRSHLALAGSSLLAISPSNQSFHHHGNAETYMRVGEAMGKAMLEIEK